MKKQAIALVVAASLGLGMFASSSAAEKMYTVRSSDTLWGISKVYNLSVADLQQLDELDTKWNYPEQTLSREHEKKLESEIDTYTIQPGDTLFKIALANNVTVAELKEWNNLTSDLIFTDETLAIKASAAKPKSSVSANKPSNNKTKKVTIAPTNTTGQSYTMRATAYTAYCTGCSGITANGTNLRSNPNLKVIAVDPRVIPLGTKVWVEGYGEAVAADTGGAIKGNKIDVFIPTDGQARNWGVRTVTVRVLN